MAHLDDAYAWERSRRDPFDVVLIDFPEPTIYSIGKLYSLGFYPNLRRILAPGGALSVQSGAPYVAPQSFAVIGATLAVAGFAVRPYHAYGPSFGDWGFTLAGDAASLPPKAFPRDLRYLDAREERTLFDFPRDMLANSPGINRLDKQLLVRTFTSEWRRYGD